MNTPSQQSTTPEPEACPFCKAIPKLSDTGPEIWVITHADMCFMSTRGKRQWIIGVRELERWNTRAARPAESADTKRLDWLEGNNSLKLRERFAHDVYATWDADKDLRSAIDSAMSQPEGAAE